MFCLEPEVEDHYWEANIILKIVDDQEVLLHFKSQLYDDILYVPHNLKHGFMEIWPPILFCYLISTFKLAIT